jgi:hypothetical protein
MTHLEFPVRYWQRIRRAWLGDAYMDEFFEGADEDHANVIAIPLNRVPDREGVDRVSDIILDPDDDTKVWEFDADLTPQEQADFDAILDRIRAGGDGSMPTEATIDGLISTMKAYRASTPGTPTSTQMDSTIRAIIDYIRYMEARAGQ